MRLFKGKNAYIQHVSVSDNEKNCAIITAHEFNTEGDDQINANSNVGANDCTASDIDVEANRAQEKIIKNGQNTKERKAAELQVDKNGEYKVLNVNCLLNTRKPKILSIKPGTSYRIC